MENKLKIEVLLYKISQVRIFSIFAILSIIIFMSIIKYLNIGIVFNGGFIYLFSLYTVLFFLTNEIIDKYKNVQGEFYMSKEVFLSFFNKSYILKIILLSLLIITLILWGFFTYKSIVFDFNLFNILFTIVLLIYFYCFIKKIIDNFVMTVFMTRIIKHICKELNIE